jgi:phage shock protein A
MALELDELYSEKALLQKDFDELRRNISQAESNLNQMKANLNAVNGAIQQTNKIINMFEQGGGAKSKAKKNEKV